MNYHLSPLQFPSAIPFTGSGIISYMFCKLTLRGKFGIFVLGAVNVAFLAFLPSAQGLKISVLWTLYYGVLSGFAPVYSWILVLRGLVGFGIGGVPQS